MTEVLVARVDKVWKRYGSQDVLKGMDLAIPQGAAYALIGANGAGKTTTIKLLLNLISPNQGATAILGVDSKHLSPQVLSQVGYVSENQVLPGRLTVGGYLDYLRPFYPSWDHALEDSLLQRLQLPATRRIGELSHGQRIKMQLACALPYRPKLLILDEPFSGLDPLIREEFMEELLLQAGEMTLLVSSHELGEIEHVATHVGFLDGGKMLLQASMEELNDRVREVRVTLDAQSLPPQHLPEDWLQARVAGNVLTFIDTRYAEAALVQRVRSLMGPVRRIDAQALPLRTVFTALARAARDGKTP